MLDTSARPVAALRQHAIRTASNDSVELHEISGVPGFMVFRCDRLHLELSPSACAKSYASPRNEACTFCPIGKRFQGELAPAAAPEQERGSLGEMCGKSDIQTRLERRAALHATGGRSSALPCIRCGKTGMTNERLIGCLRLVRKGTLCVSCFNREREVIVGANAKGALPKKWAGKLLDTQAICVEAGAQKRIPIGLTMGVDEAQRYVARVHPKARVVGVFVANDFHLLIAPHGEGLDRAKWERRERGTARKKARSVEQAPTDPGAADKHGVSETNAQTATTVLRKLAVGARIGLLELKRDVGRSQWACRCDCGRQTVRHATALRGSRQPSCGCASRAPAAETEPPRQPEHEAPKPRRTSTIVIGMQRGHLTALRHVRETKWRWRCACGNERTIEAATVLARKIRHCGCGGKKRVNIATTEANAQLRAFYASMPSVILSTL